MVGAFSLLSALARELLARRRMRNLPLLLSVLTVSVSGCTSDRMDHDPWAMLARSSACGDRLLVNETGISVELARPDASPASCRSTATSCGEWESCIGLDRTAPCTFPGEPRCDGNVAVFCSGHFGFEIREDCAADPGAGQCRVGSNGVPQCVAGACTGSSRCEGNVLVWCLGDAGERRDDCGAGTCTEADGSAFCVEEVEPCTVSRCSSDGTTLERCTPGFGFNRVPCAGVHPDYVCRNVDGAPRCTAEAPVCTDGAVECVGDTARVCVRGAWVEVPCGELQGGRCALEGDDVRCVVD